MKNSALVLEDKGYNLVNGFYCKNFGNLMNLGQVLIKKYNTNDHVHFLMNYGGSLLRKKTKGCPVIYYWGEFCCFCS